jgi:hypothetical protein
MHAKSTVQESRNYSIPRLLQETTIFVPKLAPSLNGRTRCDAHLLEYDPFGRPAAFTLRATTTWQEP